MLFKKIVCLNRKWTLILVYPPFWLCTRKEIRNAFASKKTNENNQVCIDFLVFLSILTFSQFNSIFESEMYP